MGDVRVELQELKETSDSGPPAACGCENLPEHPYATPRDHGGIGVAILAGVVVVLWRAWQPTVLSTVTVAPTLVQLTSERRAGSGSFSPDGTQIAFASAGEDGNNWDVWLKIVGQDEADVSPPTPESISIRPCPRTGHRLPSSVPPGAVPGSGFFPTPALSTLSRLSEVSHAACPTFLPDFSCRGLPMVDGWPLPRLASGARRRVGSI